MSTHASAAVFKIYASEVPPLLEKSGEGVQGLSGVFGKIVRDKIQKSGHASDFEVVWVPWKRALNQAAQEKNALFFPLARTTERENTYKWLGYLGSVESWFYAVDSRVQIRSNEDLKKYRIGFLSGSMRHEELRKILGKRTEKLDGLTEDLGNYRKLLSGRIDIWTTQTEVFEKAEKDYLKEHADAPKVRAIKKFLDQEVWIVSGNHMSESHQEQIRKIFQSTSQPKQLVGQKVSLAY
jgi:hypothetical protein